MAWCETTPHMGSLGIHVQLRGTHQTEGEFPGCYKAVFISPYVAAPADKEEAAFVEEEIPD